MNICHVAPSRDGNLNDFAPKAINSKIGSFGGKDETGFNDLTGFRPPAIVRGKLLK
jgi:hypothetical protein